MPQASVIDEPVETGELSRYYKPENHSFADAEPSKGMHIELRVEGISQSECFQLGWLEHQEHTFRKCLDLPRIRMKSNTKQCSRHKLRSRIIHDYFAGLNQGYKTLARNSDEFESTFPRRAV